MCAWVIVLNAKWANFQLYHGECVWNCNQGWNTGSSVPLLDSSITQVFLQIGYLSGSAKCSTKPLSKLLSILSAVRTGLQYDNRYSRGGVNQIWILKNSKDLLMVDTIKVPFLINSIKLFDFSTLYITIPHSMLKNRFVLGRDISYLAK
jgi:hypothetical protein